ncbi:MAG: pilus assembly protein Flp/PilA [Paraglaciecola sp.]|jgi:pilus assembly protein Flp/PilA
MSNLTFLIKNFIEDESGLTAVEYAIAGGLVVGGMVVAFVALGNNATAQIVSLGCAVNGGSIAEADLAAGAVGNDAAGAVDITAGDCV